MKLPLKHIIILVICSLTGIFVYQTYWLTGLYRTMKQEMNKVYENMGFYNTVDYACEMFNLCRLHMNTATSFSKDINEKGLKHTIETKYNYGNE